MKKILTASTIIIILSLLSYAAQEKPLTNNGRGVMGDGLEVMGGGGLLVLFAIGLVCWLIYRRRQKAGTTAAAVGEEEDNHLKTEHMKRICQLMEERKLYLNSGLKIQDIAAEMGVHPNIVSAAINSQGTTFSQFVNDYRIEYAKRL